MRDKTGIHFDTRAEREAAGGDRDRTCHKKTARERGAKPSVVETGPGFGGMCVSLCHDFEDECLVQAALGTIEELGISECH